MWQVTLRTSVRMGGEIKEYAITINMKTVLKAP